MKRYWICLQLRFEAPQDVKLQLLSRRAALHGYTSLYLSPSVYSYDCGDSEQVQAACQRLQASLSCTNMHSDTSQVNPDRPLNNADTRRYISGQWSVIDNIPMHCAFALISCSTYWLYTTHGRYSSVNDSSITPNKSMLSCLCVCVCNISTVYLW